MRGEAGVRLRPERRHVAPLGAGAVEPIVARRIEMEDRHALLQERDEGKEERAVESVLVEVVGRDVGGRDDGDAAREELLEQAAEDHRVGDVVDGEFVEAEELDLRRRVAPPPAAIGSPPFASPLFSLRRSAAMRSCTSPMKCMEMDAALPRRRRGREEEVHEQRLAASDRAPDVEPARRRRASRRARAASRARSASTCAPRSASSSDSGRARRRERAGSRPARSRRTRAIAS